LSIRLKHVHLLFIKLPSFQISSNLLKSEDDPDLEGIPRDLIQTTFQSLIVAKPNQNGRTKTNMAHKSKNPKCMKRFKKVWFILSF